MPKKFLKEILPTHEKIKKIKSLRVFGNALYKKGLWSLNRKAVIKATFVGVFIACLPIPLQMLLLAFLAVTFNINLPISFLLLWINNPFTIAPLFYLEYKLGAFLLNSKNKIEFNFNSLSENLGDIAVYLYFGSIVFGLILAFISSLAVNYLWIYLVKKKRKKSSS